VVHAATFAALFLELLQAAKFEKGGAPRLFGRHAGRGVLRNLAF
jgi:hypothetical protein